MTSQLIKYITDRSLENPQTGCLEWLLSLSKDGYGKAKYKQKTYVAHRLAWIALNGDIPTNTLVCHTCDNPKCVNVGHLFLGTPQDNMDDKMSKGRYRGGPAFWRSVRSTTNSYNHRVGSAHHNSKLTEKDVYFMRQQFRSGITNSALAALFDVSKVAVARIRRGSAWKHVQLEIA